MKQLTQKLKNGKMEVLEVPPPVLSAGMILVKNHYSLISAGTEGSTVSAARKSLIGKAKERPQQVKQVLDVLRQQGPLQTYRAVMKKLDAYSPLGYSCAGEVIDVAEDVTNFSIGEYVACGGALFANHAELVVVPRNLCVKLPENADLKKAAYNTLGAIALQGIRQADLRIGETCAVIGLGLLGQLTCLILKAGGIRTVGIDINPAAVDIALRHCVDAAFERNSDGIAEKIDEFTGGIGVDAVIITAATGSLDPINFAGRICRKKGKVIIVGDVPAGFDREPYYYKKELELKLSCSYGPGRYDISYEEKGMDYPPGYVRWTENRNMMAFQDMIHTGKVDPGYLTTHLFKLEDAPDAYDMIMNRNEPFTGILIEYDRSNKTYERKVSVNPAKDRPSSVNIAFIGAGSYAMSHLLPNISKSREVALKGVITSSGTSSRTVADRFGFEYCTSNADDLLKNAEVNTVFIATRHDSHYEYVRDAIGSGKNVFVEKPLCLREEELSDLAERYRKGSSRLMVGFNRRFSPLAEIIKKQLGNGPVAMTYRINAGAIQDGTWIQDRDIGGGRIIGEVCHFVDFMTYISGSLPEYVSAAALPDPSSLHDTANINIAFKNGSIGAISYFSNGSKSLSKEYVEIYRAGMTAVLNDFRELDIYGRGKPVRKKLVSQDKGQKHMIKAFIDSILHSAPTPISFDELYAVTAATFKIIESIRTRSTIRI